MKGGSPAPARCTPSRCEIAAADLTAASRSGEIGSFTTAGSALANSRDGTSSAASRAISTARVKHSWSTCGNSPARDAAANSVDGYSTAEPAGPRANASTPTTLPVASSMIGWNTGNTARSPSTRGIVAAATSNGSTLASTRYPMRSVAWFHIVAHFRRYYSQHGQAPVSVGRPAESDS